MRPGGYTGFGSGKVARTWATVFTSLTGFGIIIGGDEPCAMSFAFHSALGMPQGEDGSVGVLGSGGSGSTALRQMRGVSTGERLNYNLYRNNARSQLWGDGVTAGSVNASFTLNKLTAPSRTRTHTVFGRIPPLQDVAVDGYGDNVLVTINY